MLLRRKKSVFLLFASALALIALLQVPSACLAFEVTIDVSPNVLNIQSQGEVVTVHTDIDHHLVDVSTVYLNGVAINSWKSDDRGFFVAKFVMAEIKDLPLDFDAYNTLLLIGATTDGEAFMGQQDIKVINNVPQGR